MTDNIGLYVMGFMLGFAAICWIASVVCAWFSGSTRRGDRNGSVEANPAPYKVEPDYLADCEWPDEYGEEFWRSIRKDYNTIWAQGGTISPERMKKHSENNPKNHHHKEI